MNKIKLFSLNLLFLLGTPISAAEVRSIGRGHVLVDISAAKQRIFTKTIGLTTLLGVASIGASLISSQLCNYLHNNNEQLSPFSRITLGWLLSPLLKTVAFPVNLFWELVKAPFKAFQSSAPKDDKNQVAKLIEKNQRKPRLTQAYQEATIAIQNAVGENGHFIQKENCPLQLDISLIDTAFKKTKAVYDTLNSVIEAVTQEKGNEITEEALIEEIQDYNLREYANCVTAVAKLYQAVRNLEKQNESIPEDKQIKTVEQNNIFMKYIYLAWKIISGGSKQKIMFDNNPSNQETLNLICELLTTYSGMFTKTDIINHNLGLLCKSVHEEGQAWWNIARIESKSPYNSKKYENHLFKKLLGILDTDKYQNETGKQFWEKQKAKKEIKKEREKANNLNEQLKKVTEEKNLIKEKLNNNIAKESENSKTIDDLSFKHVLLSNKNTQLTKTNKELTQKLEVKSNDFSKEQNIKTLQTDFVSYCTNSIKAIKNITDGKVVLQEKSDVVHAVAKACEDTLKVHTFLTDNSNAAELFKNLKEYKDFQEQEKVLYEAIADLEQQNRLKINLDEGDKPMLLEDENGVITDLLCAHGKFTKMNTENPYLGLRCSAPDNRWQITKWIFGDKENPCDIIEKRFKHVTEPAVL